MMKRNEESVKRQRVEEKEKKEGWRGRFPRWILLRVAAERFVGGE